MSYLLVPSNSVKQIIKQVEITYPNLEQAAIFLAGDINVEEFRNSLIEKYPKLKFFGGFVEGIGDFSEKYHFSAALIIPFSKDIRMNSYNVTDDVSLTKDSLIFTASSYQEVFRVKQIANKNPKINFFGSNISSLFNEKDFLGSDDIVIAEIGDLSPYVSPLWQTATKVKVQRGILAQELSLGRPLLHEETHLYSLDQSLPETVKDGSYYFCERKPVKLKEDFLNLTKEISTKSNNVFIITCKSRIELMGTKYLGELEDEKVQLMDGQDFRGFGFAGNGIFFGKGKYFKHSSHLVAMVGIENEN